MPGPQDQPHHDERDADEAAWRAIVDNYGERAHLEDDEPEPPAAPTPREVSEPVEVVRDEEHFVPPTPPPLPRPTPRKLLAWIAVLLLPLGLLVATVAGVAVPADLSLVLMVCFVGGLAYLVYSMRSGPRDDDDDGAVV